MRKQSLPRLLLLTLVFSLPLWLDSCKKDDSTPTPTSTSIQGNWKITALNLTPAFQGVTDLASGLKTLGETCLVDVTLSFKADGSVAYDNPTSCANAATSKNVLQSLFAGTKYTETATAVTLNNSTAGIQLNTAKTVNGNTIQLQTEPTVLSINPTKTTYTLVLTRV